MWQYLKDEAIVVEVTCLSALWVWTFLGMLISGQLKDAKTRMDQFWQIVIMGPLMAVVILVIAFALTLMEKIKEKRT